MSEVIFGIGYALLEHAEIGAVEEGVGCGGVEGEGLGEEGFGFEVFGTVHFDSGSFNQEFGLDMCW